MEKGGNHQDDDVMFLRRKCQLDEDQSCLGSPGYNGCAYTQRSTVGKLDCRHTCILILTNKYANKFYSPVEFHATHDYL